MLKKWDIFVVKRFTAALTAAAVASLIAATLTLIQLRIAILRAIAALLTLTAVAALLTAAVTAKHLQFFAHNVSCVNVPAVLFVLAVFKLALDIDLLSLRQVLACNFCEASE